MGLIAPLRVAASAARIVNIAVKLSTHSPAAVTEMTTWEAEKVRYRRMPPAERRVQYLCGDKYLPLNKIKTWKDFAGDAVLPGKVPLQDGFSINSILNDELSQKISVYRGDITTLEVDAIVNAANKSLMGGGGVDGAIHRAAGPNLLKENKTLAGCRVGEAKMTGAYKLPAKYVIATVGPQGEKPDLLHQCYRNSLDLVVKQGLASVAFPCISTGVYGYPLLPAAHVAVGTARMFLEEGHNIDRIVFCLFSEVDEEVYHGVLQSYFPIRG